MDPAPIVASLIIAASVLGGAFTVRRSILGSNDPLTPLIAQINTTLANIAASLTDAATQLTNIANNFKNNPNIPPGDVAAIQAIATNLQAQATAAQQVDTSAIALDVQTEGAPAVTGISPSSGPVAGGTSVTVSGTGLAGATAVNFGTVADAGLQNGPNGTLIAISPPASAAGVVDVTVVTPNGTSPTSAADQFTYQ